MAAFIFEPPDSREATVGVNAAADTLRFKVGGTYDDDEVRALVYATLPAYYRGLVFQQYRMTPAGGGNIWEIEAEYGLRAPRDTGSEPPQFSGGQVPGGGNQAQGFPGQTPRSSLSFEVGTQNYKLTEALTQVSYAPTGQAAPDLGVSVGVNGDQVEGVEIDTPTLTWAEKHYFAAGTVDQAYLTALFNVLAKPVNNATFRGLEAGQVRITGASGDVKFGEPVDMTFKFAASPNKTGLTVGTITDISKRGWEYLWVRYEDATDASQLVKKPTAVYVAKVYEESDFTVLGIGS